jgi:hypothetical protein
LSQHTTTIHLHDPATVVLHEGAGQWYQVLREYNKLISPTLTTGPLRVMNFMFEHRDRLTGLVVAERHLIASETALSKSAVSEALALLAAHPRRPLAIEAGSVYVPMPGRPWAIRKQPTDGPPVRHGEQPVRGGELCSPGRTRHREARAPDLRDQVENQDLERAPIGTGQARAGSHEPSWPDWDSLIYAQRAIRQNDPAGLLAAIGLTDPLLSATAALDGLTVEEVIQTAEQVGRDALASLGTPKPIRKRKSVLAARLFDERGLPVPEFRPKPKGRPAPSGLADDELKARRIAELREWERSKEAGRV